MTKDLFQNHIDTVCDYTTKSLHHAASKGASFEGIVFHAGTQSYYHADDHHVNFHPTPHFVRFAPVEGSDHLLIFKPNEKPKLIEVIPQDFWYESPDPLDHPYREVLDVKVVATPEQAIQEAGNLWQFAYVGSDASFADRLGLPSSAIEPEALILALDWYRAYKTDYEIACMENATRIAARGYAIVKSMVNSGATEREVHAAYLAATNQTDLTLPYGNIIGWDSNAATLHYTAKRTTKPKPAHTLLIDAGATTFGYAVDFTRTYLTKGAHPVFVELLEKMNALCVSACEKCVAGASYTDLHVIAHKTIAQMLADVGVLNVNGEEAFEKGLSRVFFPHGLGHHLGIQVHDVGGRQLDLDGTTATPDPQYPWLRTTRPLEASHVLTVEPGLYFIPILLDPHRNGEHASCFNWEMVDDLLPLGGIRVEDNLVVEEGKAYNFSHELIGDHL